MSHVGFADSYDPPDFDVEAAAMSADAYAAKHDMMNLVRTIESVAVIWNDNYGYNDGKLGDCEHNPFLRVLSEAFDTADQLYGHTLSASCKAWRERLGV